MIPLLTLAAAALSGALVDASPSFTVAQDAFLLNGQPIQIRSGSIHYHRAHSSTWADRLRRLHAMGLNTVQGYIPWNFHSQAPGVYDFTGEKDISKFFDAVKAEGLLMNVRPGPYICGEHDFGGLPSYLLATAGISSASDLRTNNTAYMAAVTEWWTELLPRLTPYLVANGGPIAMVQLENEYGSYGHSSTNAGDRAYLMALRSLAMTLLPIGTTLYTTDGNDAGYLNGGTLPGLVFATGDGSGPPWAADAFNPPGMRAHINSELYPGWLTHWGEGMANVSAMSTVGAISGALAVNGSINLYMGYGGTNFGWNNGANGGGSDFEPVITSYDYNAPVAEGGGHSYGHDGDKYDAIRRILTYWTPAGEPSPPAEPPAPPTAAYGPLPLTASASLFPNLAALATANITGLPSPPSMESLNASSGYMLYSATLPPLPGAPSFSLTLASVSDYATVYLNGQLMGAPLWRPSAGGSATPLLPAAALSAGGAVLSILVENCGHLNYGRGWWDPKGFTGLAINGKAVAGLAWAAQPLPLSAAAVLALPYAPFSTPPPPSAYPAFFQGTLTLAAPPADTYIALCGWGKGQVYVNGVHLGRQWGERGPQHAYYIPAGLLTLGGNTITVFEHKGAPANASVLFVAQPDFTGQVCGLAGGRVAEQQQAGSSRGRQLPPPPPPARTPPPAPPATAGAACSPTSATPTQGAALTMQPCSSGSTAGAVSEWAWLPVSGEAGLLQLAANSSLCAAPVGGNFQLALCDKGDRGQHLLPFPDNGMTLLNPISGQCMEAFGGINSGVGSAVDLYGCNGGKNQGWALTPAGASVQAVNQQAGLCIAACQ